MWAGLDARDRRSLVIGLALMLTAVLVYTQAG